MYVWDTKFAGRSLAVTVIVRSTKYVSVLAAAVRVTESCADDDDIVDIDVEVEVKNVVGTALVLLSGLAGAEALAGIGIDVLIGCGICWEATDVSRN
jgi:hypothetical protein